MKDPINIALAVLVVLLIGYTVFKNTGDGANQAYSVPVGPVDASGYTVLEVEGTPVKKLEKRDANGILQESGETLDGLKTGTWMTYSSEGRVKTISPYLAGKLNGVYLEMNDRGQVELQASFTDDILHGSWTKYKSGSRKEEERFYNMGQLDGDNKFYDQRGKLQKEIGYKNGVQHGMFRHYDENGNVTLEYEYKDGEKVRGGIVEKK